jgi:Oxidoreductase family, NAD-binding Rossmann fold
MTKSPLTFALVGGAWRAEFFLRIAREMPGRFRVAGCYSKTTATRAKIAQEWNISAYESLDELAAAKPDFVVLSVPRAISPCLILELTARGLPVLAETPPADQLADMIHLWEKLPQDARVQVAEQYPFQPLHAARLALACSGKLGKITQAQVSAAHGYHGVVLIRKFLGVLFEPAVIEAYEFKSPIVQGRGREPGPKEEKVVDSGQVIARLQFSDKLGIYDFTGDQYFSWIRSQRLLVRGEKGEINNLEASYLADFKTPINLRFERRDAGQHGNLEGLHHKGYLAGDRWIYQNPFIPARLADDEIAIATCLESMGHYLETGQGFYGLAEACQDHYLALLIDQAVKSARPVTSEAQVWNK